MIKLPVQFVKFGMVGGTNTFIHAVVLYAVVEGEHAGPVLGNFLAFAVANISSFFMNSYWTFKQRPTPSLYAKFLLGSLLALALTLCIAALFEFLAIDYWLGFVCIVVCVPPLNFLMLKHWAYAKDVQN